MRQHALRRIFFHVINHHAAWWRLLFELFYGFIDLVFLSLTFLLSILDKLEKKLCFAKENPDSILAPDSMRFLAAIWKTSVCFPQV